MAACRIHEPGAGAVAGNDDQGWRLGHSKARGDIRPLVHIDAHLDTYDRMGTWFGVVDSAAHWASRAVHERLVDPAASIQLGMRGHMSPWTQSNVSDELGYIVIEKAACDEMGLEALIAVIRERIGDRPTYVSFDLDSLDPSVAPAVSNIEPGEDGFTMSEASRILQGLRGSGQRVEDNGLQGRARDCARRRIARRVDPNIGADPLGDPARGLE